MPSKCRSVCGEGFGSGESKLPPSKCLYFISIETRAPFGHDDLKSKKKTAQRRKFNSWMRFFSGSWGDFMQTFEKVSLKDVSLKQNAPSSLSLCHFAIWNLKHRCTRELFLLLSTKEKKSCFMFWSLQVVCCYKLGKKAQYIEYLQVNQFDAQQKSHAF